MLSRKTSKNRPIKTKKQILHNFTINGQRTGLQPKPNLTSNTSKPKVQEITDMNVPHHHADHQINITDSNPQTKLIPVDDVLERIRKFRLDLRSTMKSASLQTQHFLNNAQQPLRMNESLEIESIMNTEHEIDFTPTFDSIQSSNCRQEGEDDPNLPDFNVIDIDPNDDIEGFRDIYASKCNQEGSDSNHMISCIDEGLDLINSAAIDERETYLSDDIGQDQYHEEGVLEPSQTDSLLTNPPSQNYDHAENIGELEVLPVGPCIAPLEIDRIESESVRHELTSCSVGHNNSYHCTNDIGTGNDDKQTVDIGLQPDPEISMQSLNHIAVQSNAIELVESGIGHNNVVVQLVDIGVGDQDLFVNATSACIDIGVGDHDLEVRTQETGIGQGILTQISRDIGINVNFTSEPSQSEIGIQVGTGDAIEVREIACNTRHISLQNASVLTATRSCIDQNIGTDDPECQATRHQATETDPLEANLLSRMPLSNDFFSKYRQESSDSELIPERSRVLRKAAPVYELKIQECLEEPLCHSSVQDAASQIMSELDNVLARLRQEVAIADELLQSDQYLDTEKPCIENANASRVYNPLASVTNHNMSHKVRSRPDHVLPSSEKRMQKFDYKGSLERFARKQYDNGNDWISAVKENRTKLNDVRDSTRSRSQTDMHDNGSSLFHTGTIDKGPPSHMDIIKRHIYRHGLHYQ